MDNSKRIATVFMAVGLLVALGIGVVVWKMSSPKAGPDPSYQADAAGQTSAAVSEAADKTDEQPPEDERDGDDSTDLTSPPRGGASRGAVDPLMPPNAVVNSTPRRVEPTQVYRPSNVVPTSVAPTRNDSLRQSPSGAAREPQAEFTEPQPQRALEPAPQRSSQPEQPAPQSPTPESSSAATTAPTPQSSEAPTTSGQPTQEQSVPSAAELTLPSLQPQPQRRDEAPAVTQQQQELPAPSDPVTWWNRVRGIFS